MRSVLAYTAARLLLFAVTFGVLYLLGARGLLAAALAVLISGLVSYVLLSRQRDAMSGGIADRISRVRGLGSRLEAGAAKEDAAQQAADRPDPESGPAESAAATDSASGAAGRQPAAAQAGEESPAADESGEPDESRAVEDRGTGGSGAESPTAGTRQEAG